ncbi:hypothetical protein HWV62_30033, partial [Athelia sp. TMB]
MMICEAQSPDDLKLLFQQMTNTSATYDPAFTEEDATIVLTSSDGTNYRLHPFTLRTTSGFFRHMMTLPPGSSRNRSVQGSESDQITLSEGSDVLGRLLKMISGLPLERQGSAEEVQAVLAAAKKYDMPGPIDTIRSSFTSSSKFMEDPLITYAIAARNGWDEVAQLASSHTINECLQDEEHQLLLQQIP